MHDETIKFLNDVKRRNADIQALTANDLEADALVAVALTKVGEAAVDTLAKEVLGSAHLPEEEKAIFKLRLKALFPEKGGALMDAQKERVKQLLAAHADTVEWAQGMANGFRDLLRQVELGAPAEDIDVAKHLRKVEESDRQLESWRQFNETLKRELS